MDDYDWATCRCRRCGRDTRHCHARPVTGTFGRTSGLAILGDIIGFFVNRWTCERCGERQPWWASMG